MAFNGSLIVSEKYLSGNIWASPSQLETFAICPRKWYFKAALKLPEPMKGSTTFGTVLHGVAERYLRADDLGRDSTGRPVELYPPGWDLAEERDGQRRMITVSEQARIKKLIDTAIEAGFLARRPNRYVEFEFKEYPVIPGVSVVGKIDLLEPDTITDHKTVKAMKYAASPGKLKSSIQMNLYARIGTEFYREKGIYTPDPIVVRHINYCKDENDIRVRETRQELSCLDVDSFWSRAIIPAAYEMLKVKQAEDASEVPDPPNLSTACNAYGGCAFLSICSGRERADTYKKRIEFASQSITPGGKLVNFGEMLNQQNQQQAPAPRRPEAPWSWPGCTACEASPVAGFNSVGNVCRICDDMQHQKLIQTQGQDGIESQFFVISGKGGEASWTPTEQWAGYLASKNIGPGSAAMSAPSMMGAGKAQTVIGQGQPIQQAQQPIQQWQPQPQAPAPQAQQGPPAPPVQIHHAQMIPPAQQAPHPFSPPQRLWQPQPAAQAAPQQPSPQQQPPQQQPPQQQQPAAQAAPQQQVPSPWQQPPQQQVPLPWQQPAPAPAANPYVQQPVPTQPSNPTEREMDAVAAIITNPKKAGPGRPKNGIQLFLGCSPTKGIDKMQSLDGVFSQVCEDIGRVNGRAFNQIEPQARRDILAQYVPWLVKNWGSNVKVVGALPHKEDADFCLFVQRLREHVDVIIESGFGT